MMTNLPILCDCQMFEEIGKRFPNYAGEILLTYYKRHEQYKSGRGKLWTIGTCIFQASRIPPNKQKPLEKDLVHGPDYSKRCSQSVIGELLNKEEFAQKEKRIEQADEFVKSYRKSRLGNILALIRVGKTKVQIAKELNISLATVKQDIADLDCKKRDSKSTKSIAKSFSEEEKQKHITNIQNQKIPIRTYCRQNNLKYTTVYCWFFPKKDRKQRIKKQTHRKPLSKEEIQYHTLNYLKSKLSIRQYAKDNNIPRQLLAKSLKEYKYE